MPRFGVRAARDIWWFFLIVLIGHTGLVSFNILRDAQNDALVNHTLQVSVEISRLMSSCIDIETEIRGFVITGDNAFVESYQTAKEQIPPLVRRLQELTRDNTVQQASLEQVDNYIGRRQELLRQLRVERQRTELNQPAIVELVREGKRVTDGIRTELAKMQAEEHRLLQLREASNRATFVTSIITTITGGALTVGMLVLALYLMKREFETRRSSEAAIRLSNERFGTLAETVPQIVWVAQANGEVEFFNHRWFEYTGLKEDGVGGAFGAVVHPQDQENARRVWDASVKSGNAFEDEFRLRRHDNTYRWFLGRALPMHNSAGRIVQWFGTCTDIDDQKRAKEELEQRVRERTAELNRVVEGLSAEIQTREQITEELRLTAAELTRSNRELEQFAYVASHDLQEPLRKIQAFSDRLKVKFGESIEGQGREYVDRMQNAAARMRQLINDLLTYSRVSTRSRNLTDVDLGKVANEVLDDLDDSVSQTGADIDVGALPTITADPLQMRQLFQNLISNALKFRKPGSRPKITIRAETLERFPSDSLDVADRKTLKLTFSDQGIGFDPVYADRIFQVFQRLHGRDVYEGTGIGLAVVRKIAERHGGTVAVDSTPGSGATFTVLLPFQHYTGDENESLSAIFSKENTIP